MKRKFLIPLFAILMALPALTKAQSDGNPVIYKEWALLGESKTFLDVSYRIIKCTSVVQIHLNVFNESPKDQTANFDIEITNNNDGQKVTKSITYSLKMATMYKADCDSESSFDALKIDLPNGYDPTNITTKITFK